MLTILLVSTADTELLAAAASGASYLTANPARVTADQVPALAARADLVVLRLLGGRNAWPEGVAALTAAGKPLVALGGEAAPDAELMALSTVPAGVATEALGYLREGGPETLLAPHQNGALALEAANRADELLAHVAANLVVLRLE